MQGLYWKKQGPKRKEPRLPRGHGSPLRLYSRKELRGSQKEEELDTIA